MLYGPSCTGKSTIIRRLVAEHGFHQINCYTTRTVRPGEDNARIIVSNSDYDQLHSDSFFIFHNEQFNAKYGTPKQEIEEAHVNTERKFVLDYMIRNREQLKDFDHLKIIIVPDSKKSLEMWVVGSGRLERLNAILRDFEENYNYLRLEEYKAEGFYVIVNAYGLLDDTINEIVSLSNDFYGNFVRRRRS